MTIKAAAEMVKEFRDRMPRQNERAWDELSAEAVELLTRLSGPAYLRFGLACLFELRSEGVEPVALHDFTPIFELWWGRDYIAADPREWRRFGIDCEIRITEKGRAALRQLQTDFPNDGADTFGFSNCHPN
jgi:hypothetical protein